MEEKVRQPQLLDAYIDDLLQNPRISPPLDLNLELAEITREVVLTQQHTAANNAAWAAQERVWKQVMDVATFSPAPAQTGVFGWQAARVAGSQLVAGLLLGLVMILILIGPHSQAAPATSVSESVVAAELPTTPSVAALTTPTVLSDSHTSGGDSQASAVLATKTASPLRNVRSNLLNDGPQYALEAALAPDIDETETHQGFNSHHLYYR